jgi:hypothetical protein
MALVVVALVAVVVMAMCYQVGPSLPTIAITTTAIAATRERLFVSHLLSSLPTHHRHVDQQ